MISHTRSTRAVLDLPAVFRHIERAIFLSHEGAGVSSGGDRLAFCSPPTWAACCC